MPGPFTQNEWKLFMNFYGLKSNPEFAYAHSIGSSTTSYTYSMKTVGFIVDRIYECPDTMIGDLKSASRKEKRWPQEQRILSLSALLPFGNPALILHGCIS